MRYDRFEQLPVWRTAVDIGERVGRLVEHPYFRGRGGLRDQLDRASVSISNNIAEGFERGTTEELITFVYYARGSAGEVRSMCHLIQRRTVTADTAAPGTEGSGSEISDLKSQISDLRLQVSELIPVCESASQQLRGWAEHLQNSGIEGPRRLTDEGRARFQREQQRAAFIKQLEQTRPRIEEPG